MKIATPKENSTYCDLPAGERPFFDAAADSEARRIALESAYHGLIAASICNLQSQTAWLAAIVMGQPCNLSKISECKAWADRAWAQYQLDKAAGLSVPTFSEPQPPYSFMETMTPL